MTGMKNNKHCPNCLTKYTKGFSLRPQVKFCNRCGTRLVVFNPRAIRERKVMAALQFNARASLAELSRQTGIKPCTIHDTLKKMEVVYIAAPKELQPHLQELLRKQGHVYGQ